MPMYEYRCKTCGLEFEELVFGNRTPACPACHGTETEKKLSSPCRYNGESGFGGGEHAAPASSHGSGCSCCSGGNCSSCH